MGENQRTVAVEVINDILIERIIQILGREHGIVVVAADDDPDVGRFLPYRLDGLADDLVPHLAVRRIRNFIQQLEGEMFVMSVANRKFFPEIIEDLLQKNRRYVEGVISYSDGRLLADVHKYGTVIEEEYAEEGIRIKAYLPDSVRLTSS